MDDLHVMAAARAPSKGSGSAVRRHSFLLLLNFGALLVCIAGVSASPSSSLSVFSNDIYALDQREYLTLHDGSSRHLLQTVPNVSTVNETFKLATSRTDRPNPRHYLKKYRGGFNLSSRNYGASVAYTGLPAFIVTLLWIALGFILLSTLLFMCCCCRHRTKHEFDHGRLGYILTLLALILFTIAAIIGSILLFYAQKKFDHELKATLNYVVNQSETTEAGLRQVSSNLTSAASINVEGFFTLTDSDKAEILQLNSQLNSSANDLQRKTVDNRKKIKHAIEIVGIVLIVVAAVMLALVLLGLLFSALGIRSIVYLLILVGWILVVATWILCGIFIIIDNGVGDTCLAMREWVDNPQQNTSLDRFFPCDEATAATALSSSRDFTVKIVGLVNLGLSIVNLNVPPGTSTWYNQSGPLVPSLCNIYGSAPDYAPVTCGNGTVTFAQASRIWAGYICTADSNGICSTQGRLTPSYYTQLTMAAGTAGSLSTNADFLVDVANCTFVRNVFTEIRQDRCHRLRKHSKWVWIGLILVSAGAMLSILSWIVYIRRRKYRYKSKQQQQQPIFKGQSQPYSPTPTAASPAA